jgi:four helix bundle protein
MVRKNEVLELSFEFALNIIKYCEELESKKKNVIAQQMLKSGTSIGANIREAQNSESKQDFIHKLKIAAKEASEIEYWLLLCQKSESYPSPDELLLQINSIEKLLNTIIATTKRNL